jgi:hypothetical protein
MRRLDVFCRPTGGAVLSDGVEGTGKAAVGIGFAGPDVALVDMGVAIDEGRECDAATAVDAVEASGPAAAGRISRIVPPAMSRLAGAKPSTSKARPSVRERCDRCSLTLFRR